MAYGYQRPDPIDLFRNAVGHYKKLIDAAKEEGFTEEQAIELLKVYQLDTIGRNTGLIGGNY